MNHEPQFGPFLYEVCDVCNHDGHTCHFCGDSLRHDERDLDGTEHPCYREAHIDRLRAQLRSKEGTA